jgi:hypothetical protein
LPTVVEVRVAALSPLVMILPSAAALAPLTSVSETVLPEGFVTATVMSTSLVLAEAAEALKENVEDASVPTVVVTDGVVTANASTVSSVSARAAFAGTTDKSPNPSEATATADTFFNEIVFTIFLSFSQIKEFLLSGW